RAMEQTMNLLLSLLLSLVLSDSPRRTGGPTSRRSPRREARRRLATRRPHVEALEDRKVPTAVAVPSHLVSWWTGNNTAADLMGAHNGTLVGGTTYAPGEVGQAFSFDGINDTVTLAGTFGGTAEATLEAWVKPTGSTGDLQAIVSATDSF